MKIRTLVKICIVYGLCLLVQTGWAQSESSEHKAKSKHRTYNRRVNWSASPFDTSVKNATDDDRPFFEEDFGNLSTPSLDTLNMPTVNYEQPTRRPKYRDTTKPGQTDDGSDLLSGATDSTGLLDEKKNSETDWGWLANAVLEEKKDDISSDENGGNDTEETDRKNLRSQHNDAMKNQQAIRFNSQDKSPMNQSSYRSSYSTSRGNPKAPAGAMKYKRAETSGDRPVEKYDYTEKETTAKQDNVLASWEKEMGLDKPSSDGTSLPTSRELTESIVSRMAKPISAERNSSATFKEGSPRFSAKDRYQNASSDPIRSPTRSASPAFGNTFGGPANDRQNTTFNSSWKQQSFSPSSGYEPSSYRSSGRTTSLSQPGWSAGGIGEQKTTPSKLETFRSIHDTSGGIQQFDKGSSSWMK